MGGFAMGYTFDSKSGQIMAALLLMIVSFYAGILFGNNAPLYVSQLLCHLGFLQNASVCKFPDLYCLFS